MAQMENTAANMRPLIGALVKNLVAGESMTVGECVAMYTDGYVYRADANDGNLYKSVGILIASRDGETTVESGAGCSVVTLGPCSGWDELQPGTFGYVSETTGEVDDTAPSGSAYVFSVGYALSEDTFFVMPGFHPGTST